VVPISEGWYKMWWNSCAWSHELHCYDAFRCCNMHKGQLL
jgi:hypothetical protein